MAYDPKAIANYLLDAAEAKGETLSPMKLQKLAFFAYGWHLALAAKPLMAGGVQAWKYGPVVRSIYNEFREFGNQPISRRAKHVRLAKGPNGLSAEEYTPTVDNDPSLDDKALTKAILDRVYVVYGKYNGLQLSDMTHREGTPWRTVRDACQGPIPMGLQIPDEVIKHYFEGLIEKKTPAQSIQP